MDDGQTARDRRNLLRWFTEQTGETSRTGLGALRRDMRNAAREGQPWAFDDLLGAYQAGLEQERQQVGNSPGLQQQLNRTRESLGLPPEESAYDYTGNPSPDVASRSAATALAGLAGAMTGPIAPPTAPGGLTAAAPYAPSEAFTRREPGVNPIALELERLAEQKALRMLGQR